VGLVGRPRGEGHVSACPVCRVAVNDFAVEHVVALFGRMLVDRGPGSAGCEVDQPASGLKVVMRPGSLAALCSSCLPALHAVVQACCQGTKALLGGSDETCRLHVDRLQLGPAEAM
jgi:hypothetical protein